MLDLDLSLGEGRGAEQEGRRSPVGSNSRKKKKSIEEVEMGALPERRVTGSSH